MVSIDIGNVNFKMLREQKLSLLKVIDIVDKSAEQYDLNGVLHLIDYIQDQAAKQLGDVEVFGKEKGETGE